MTHGRKTSLPLTLNLTPEERQTLLAWQRSTTMHAGRARRGRIILLVAEGVPLSHIADTVGISRRFVYKWAKRFLHERVAGLADRQGRGTRSRAAPAEDTSASLHPGDDTASTGTHGRG
jgi:transposase